MPKLYSGAEIVFKCLEDQKVEHIFGYPGGAVLPIYDELKNHPSIKHILVRHEQGAGHAAEGYARSTGKPGVVLVTSGPGATNVVTALTDAYMDSVPLVCISGQVPTHLIGTDAFQECDTTGITRPCTKHNWLVKNINDLPRIMHEAFEVATTGRPGPVLVDIPKDIQFAKTKYFKPSKKKSNLKIKNRFKQKDIDQLVSDMYKLVLPPGDKILHVIPQEYTIDSEQGITDPIGMSGVRLEANFHIITGQITASHNIDRCVRKAGLQVADMTLEPIASATSVLSKEEKEAGIALVDIGGGTTDITIFQEGIIRHTAVIPFGGNVITKDIKEGCSVIHQQAEKLKIKFGSALSEEVYDNRIITIPGLKGRDPREISEKNLARIIQARVEEIMEFGK